MLFAIVLVFVDGFRLPSFFVMCEFYFFLFPVVVAVVCYASVFAKHILCSYSYLQLLPSIMVELEIFSPEMYECLFIEIK